METAGTLQKRWKNKGFPQGRRRKWSGLLGATRKILRKMENSGKPLVKQRFGAGATTWQKKTGPGTPSERHGNGRETLENV